MLNVMTTNIRFANPRDGEHDWCHRKDFLAELILKESPHLLGTQEGREPQLRELESLLPGLRLVDDHRDWIEERMYPCIFLNEEKFELIGSGDIWLSETPDVPGSKSFNSAFPRLCSWAHVKEKKTGKHFTYANCHLDHVEEETRIAQAKVLCQEINKKRHKEAPLIITGDFNTSPRGPVREVIEKSWQDIVDPWFVFDLPEETSFHKFDGQDPDGSKTRIDWILHENKLEPQNIKLIKDHKNGLYPSDHFFVSAQLKF